MEWWNEEVVYHFIITAFSNFNHYPIIIIYLLIKTVSFDYNHWKVLVFNIEFNDYSFF